jgi:hypothetical protein
VSGRLPRLTGFVGAVIANAPPVMVMVAVVAPDVAADAEVAGKAGNERPAAMKTAVDPTSSLRGDMRSFCPEISFKHYDLQRPFYCRHPN